MEKKAFITGVGGQDGSYLSEFLLSKGYIVHGLVRRSSYDNKKRLTSSLTHPSFLLIEGDITDAALMTSIISSGQYDEFYNLAAQSHVGTSFSEPLATFEVDAKAPLIQLEAIRNYSKHTRYYQASTSELFGSSYSYVDEQGKIVHECGEVPKELIGVAYQGIKTPFKPNSPYAVAKLAAHEGVRMYREAYNLHASAGILFNHDGPRRGTNFVTRKITKYIGDLTRFVRASGKAQINNFGKLKLGNLNAYRDWSHAKDMVYAMWLMLQNDSPKDYVVASGKTTSIHSFLAQSFAKANYHKLEQFFLEVSESQKRPHDVNYLCGDSTEIRKELGWKPFYNLDRLIGEMVDYDIQNNE